MNGDLNRHPTGLTAEYSLLLVGGLHHFWDLTFTSSILGQNFIEFCRRWLESRRSGLNVF